MKVGEGRRRVGKGREGGIGGRLNVIAPLRLFCSFAAFALSLNARAPSVCDPSLKMAASGGTGSGGTSTTNFPDELIIRHVRDHSCLYDPRETEYKDADRKAAVWREIANNVGMSAIECEHRWRYLRDRYTRERKRKSQQTNGCKSGSGGNWPLASQMHFIQDFIKHRSFKFKARGGGGGGSSGGQQEATSDGTNTPRGARQQHVKSEGDNNHTSSDETDGPVSPGFDQQSAAAAECYPMVIIEETDGHHHIGPPRSGTPSDYLRGGGGATDHHHHHHRSSAFNNGGSTSPRMTYNEDELFCLSVAQTLRRLPLMRRSLAKVQILQLIHDMEFGSHS